jgi:sugar lactone lactonase YvrE
MSAALLLAAAVTAQAAPRASSELTREGVKHSAALAFDGLLTTSWAEGVAGSSAGAWIEVDLGRPTTLQSVTIWPGDLSKGTRSHRESARPLKVQLSLDGQPLGEPVRLEVDKPARADFPVNGAGRKLRVEVVEAQDGYVLQDVHIAEIAVNFPTNEPANTSKLDAWMKTPEAAKKADAFNAEIDAAYERIKAAQFGDNDALQIIMDAVSDGPAFLRPQVARLVPDGFRAQAIRSSGRAQKALRLLKDANAIPAIEMASLRATAEEQVELSQLVEIFYAWQELIGTENRNVGYWGEPGNMPGALQSFGEPINLEVDREGRVLIADIGNNRIQRFTGKGRPERQWGPARDITNRWFQGARPWYASGAGAGEQSGAWVNPLDLTLIPGKESDGFAGIDALGRVQIYDGDGKPLRSWTVETRSKPRPGVGGEAYIAWHPKKKQLIAILEDEAVAYTLDSEEVGRFKLPDGTPNAVEVGKDGKLLMAYGREVILYSADGFRHGTVIPYEQLDEGFEDMDLTLDEDGKLWVLTDTGYVHVFEKPSKKLWSLKVIERPLTHPRMAVREGVVFIVSDDRIERIDALQKKLDKEQAEKDGGGEK